MPRFDLDLLPPDPDLSFEHTLWQAGEKFIAGIDEAGRGALAGPVAAGAVILTQVAGLENYLQGVRDSKQLMPVERLAAREKIMQYTVSWGVGYATHDEIDQLGIVPATRLAATRALENLSPYPTHLLLDYLFLPDIDIPQTSLVKGDCRSLSIAAASILAKTARDALMCELGYIYPEYGFAAHKGYGTRVHREAIQQFGPCPIHRLSFALHGDEIALEAE